MPFSGTLRAGPAPSRLVDGERGRNPMDGRRPDGHIENDASHDLGFSMMVTQSFLYNAIFFSYALVLAHFYHLASDQIGFFFIPFAIGNLLGPLVLGGLFDTVGRRVMITLTYCVVHKSREPLVQAGLSG